MDLARETARLTLKSVYTTLDIKKRQIRVIDVEPAGDDADGQIRANLVHVSLDDSPEYETVSYAWGDPTQRTEIILDGSRFQVPASAAQALRRLRYADRTRRLWIDSICINQANDQERSQQVAIMGNIYRQTWRNLVWLGEHGDSDFERDVELNLKILVDDMREQTDNFRNLVSVVFDSNNRVIYSNTGILNLRPEPVLWLYKLDWFSRLWVVQEIVLAPESICHLGGIIFSLDDVLNAAVWLRYKHYHLNIPTGTHFSYLRAISLWNLKGFSLDGWKCEKYGKDNVIKLSNLMGYTPSLRTSDPRDRIYGLLGLVGLDGNLQLQEPCLVVPDYEKSTQEAYRDAMAAMIATSEVHPLHDVCYRSDADFDESRPSWVPKWDRDYDVTYDAIPINFFVQPDKVTNLWKMKTSAEGTVLSAFGVSLGDAVVVSKVVRQVHIKNGSAFLEIINEFRENLSERMLAHKDVDSALRWTLMAGTDCHGLPAKAQDADDFEAFERYIKVHGTSPTVPYGCDLNAIQDDNLRDASRFYQAVWPTSCNRRLFCTRSGYIGLGPGILKTGDVVYILRGLDLPAVLRPQDGEALKFRYVGHSYVAEMMHGEVLRRFGGDHQLSQAMKCVSIE